MKCHFLLFSPTLNASTWTAAKNEVLKGLSFKPMGFLVYVWYRLCSQRHQISVWHHEMSGFIGSGYQLVKKETVC